MQRSDGNKNVKKKVVISKTRTLHVQQLFCTFLYRFWTYDYDVEMLNFKLHALENVNKQQPLLTKYSVGRNNRDIDCMQERKFTC